MNKVEVLESTVVSPSEETPQLGLWLSNLDLIMPNTHTPMVYYYPAPTPPAGDDFFSPHRLRKALARALVLFYPLAGRLGVDVGGRPQIHCNGEGALFVVARADLAGEDLFGNGNYEPSPEIRRMFVPSSAPPCPLAMFQVTFLKCGGVVLGTGLHHVPTDGIGAFHFMQTWTGLARGLAISEACRTPPSHDRTPLRARSPPHSDFDHLVYKPTYLTAPPRNFISRLYSISPKQLADIKSRCAPHVSTYCAVTTHLFRCMCVVRGLAPGSDVRLGLPANIRHRVRPPLPPHFFGNAIVRDQITIKAGQPLGLVAETIRKAVEHTDDAYVRSVIDYLELEAESEKKKKQKGIQAEAAPHAQWDLWVVSWLGMPMYDADFGWGAPQFVAPAQTFISSMAYVLQGGAERDDGIAVLMVLEPEHVQSFEGVFYTISTTGSVIEPPSTRVASMLH